jgi:hypothetical protein
MEDFRQNLLREHLHLSIDASEKHMVSPIFQAGGKALSRQKTRRIELTLPVWKKM